MLKRDRMRPWYLASMQSQSNGYEESKKKGEGFLDVVIMAEKPKESQKPQVIDYKVKMVGAGPLDGEEERSRNAKMEEKRCCLGRRSEN